MVKAAGPQFGAASTQNWVYLCLDNAKPFLNFQLFSEVLIHLIVLVTLPSNVKPLLKAQLCYDVRQNHIVLCN